MIKLFVLFAVGVFTRQAYCDAPEKIVGGNYAYAGQFKHQVSLQMYGRGNHFCGGSIISPTQVITAAHCVENRKNDPYTEIVAGITQLGEEGSRHRIKCIRLHSEYSPKLEDAWKNDIAVITVTPPFNFNDKINKIPLPNQHYTDGTKRAITSGFGKISANSDVSYYLKYVEVRVLSQSQCMRAHSYPTPNENHMCTLEAVGQGICQGDSGGPLVINGQLVGVTSWNSPCARGVADVFTSVYPFLGFIKQCENMC